MEDRMIMTPLGPDSMMCAVLDGHGGFIACTMLANRMIDATKKMIRERGSDTWQRALTNMFFQLDRELVDTMAKGPHTSVYAETASGACATIVIVTPTEIVTANVGDCNGYLKRGGDIIPLVQIHEPASETARIEAAGGVVKSNRVNGSLAVSRAFGDFMFKRPNALVLVDPFVSVVERQPADEYILVSSDGIENDVAVIDKDVQTGLGIFDEETMFHIPHFVNMSSKKSDNYSTCIVFLRPFDRVTKRERYSPTIRRIVMCAYEASAINDNHINTNFAIAMQGQDILSEEIRCDHTHPSKWSTGGAAAPEAAPPAGCILAPHVFSHMGNLVAIHTHPFIRDPG
jgi:serine/threonine protein phosphatase PrpC